MDGGFSAAALNWSKPSECPVHRFVIGCSKLLFSFNKSKLAQCPPMSENPQFSATVNDATQSSRLIEASNQKTVPPSQSAPEEDTNPTEQH
ncbi:hypothetical protein KIN20_034027 [Parelaphostrongylus tenuis]|uniref:Uncharacterized protein n=1 Tax=Parelaphostrongylus tenuis TaxID=148309 RepID=A0AAD5WJQ8_PARTN|nr:hypothetical protein KIN20_034027 [Parelaphostrongylus tenuis]